MYQGGLAILINTFIGGLSLPAHKRRPSEYIRLGVNGLCGLGLCLVSLIKYNWNLKLSYLESAWMIPCLVLTYFLCVIANHVRIPGKSKAH